MQTLGVLIQKPKALMPGDTLGIAAPASPFNPDDFKKGIGNLEKMGFKVYFRPDIFDKKSYLAGSDQRRLDELIELLENPDIRGILFARGGYGLMRLLPKLEKAKLNVFPKVVLGYSDITVLLVYLYQRFGWTTFYGPVVALDLSHDNSPDTLKFFREAITRTTVLPPFVFPEVESAGDKPADGIVVGGCLSLIVSLLGTPFDLNTNDKILFLEDVNEKPYAVDRMLTQMLAAGKFKNVRGIVFGPFVNGGHPSHFQETALDVLQDFQGPILFHFPAGHGPVKVTLPLGIRARIDQKKKSLEYLEAACIP